MSSSAALLSPDSPRVSAQLKQEGYTYLPSVFAPPLLRALASPATRRLTLRSSGSAFRHPRGYSLMSSDQETPVTTPRQLDRAPFRRNSQSRTRSTARVPSSQPLDRDGTVPI